jgi:hypothetical protein
MYDNYTSIDSSCDGLMQGCIHAPSHRPSYTMKYKCTSCIIFRSLVFYINLACIITRGGLHNLVARGPTLWITVERTTIKGHYYKSQARTPALNDSLFISPMQSASEKMGGIKVFRTGKEEIEKEITIVDIHRFVLK